VQLGKLRRSIGPIQATGAEVFAISNDDRAGASRMAGDLRGAIRVLSDPSMRVIYRYGMKGQNMAMAQMGYVLIDRAGVVRAREPEPRFGERVDDIVASLRQSTS
jgi:peroxiredoxin